MAKCNYHRSFSKTIVVSISRTEHFGSNKTMVIIISKMNKTEIETAILPCFQTK